MKRKGFTLIELLVVIAIIAILAAILFPVFAQARESALATSCLSNAKQQGLALMMYAQDYDEVAPLLYRQDVAGTPGVTWIDLLQPYVKSYNLFICPNQSVQPGDVDTSTPAGFRNGVNWAYYMGYAAFADARALDGGNFQYWVTWRGGRGTNSTVGWLTDLGVPWGMRYNGIMGVVNISSPGLGFRVGAVPSRSIAAVARPAEFVVIFDGGEFDALAHAAGDNRALGLCDVPTNPIPTEISVFNYVGPVPRHKGGARNNQCDRGWEGRKVNFAQGTTSVTFLDGHTKNMPILQLLRMTPREDTSGAPCTGCPGNSPGYATLMWPDE